MEKRLTICFYIALSVCLITPLGNDIFLPSLPKMAYYFQTSYIQWVMSFFLFGLALPQLIYGLLFDRFGRKPVLIGGLIIFTLSSISVAAATSIEILLLSRFLQAVGACCSVAGSLAIARDVYAKEQLVKVIGMIMLMIGVSPVLSPLLGGYLQQWFGWRASFELLVILGVFYLFLITFTFKEIHLDKNKNALNFKHIT